MEACKPLGVTQARNQGRTWRTVLPALGDLLLHHVLCIFWYLRLMKPWCLELAQHRELRCFLQRAIPLIYRPFEVSGRIKVLQSRHSEFLSGGYCTARLYSPGLHRLPTQ